MALSALSPLRGGFALLAAVALGTSAQAQFVNNTTDIPQGNPFNNSRTENVDFGDIDLDGDWDAVFADGGDADQDQNRIWVNMGGAQAGTEGVFDDQTSTRAPSVNDQSRDIEFADIDGDADLDIYVSNTSAIIAQSNRWWINQGGIQAGSIGFYADETLTRWVDLGVNGSSVPSGAVFGSGGFRDWSCDCDFADLDNDGDLDLVHSSYGGAFGGQVPTRIFLNDGAGFFSEFNPSGFQLAGDQIANGQPGLWCEGTQQANTTNSDGTFCDIASTPLDIDVADFDGDYDIDILHGARQEAPRIFQNRLEENDGVLGFRDVTGASFQAGYTSGSGHYEEEVGDVDGDGDIDIYGLNWLSSGGLSDNILKNNGSGFFGDMQVLPGSGSDDNEGDFFDWDNDGDLDIYVANFSGQDRLYTNDGNGNYTLDATQLPSLFATALDADCGDLDGDGDYDVMVGNDFGAANYYVENQNDIPDTHAPYIPSVEKVGDRVAGPQPTVIRAQVYDNAPYYITFYNPTVLKVTVDGNPIADIPMVSSGGQIFRGEIPGDLIGVITYQVESSDEYGNTGQSLIRTFDSEPGSKSCFGVACPCGNDDSDAGCANSTGSGALLSGSGGRSAGADDLVLTATGVAPNNNGLCYMGSNAVQANFFDGFQCALGTTFRFLGSIQSSGAGGTMTYTGFGADSGLITAGSTWHFHFWYRDVPGTPCGTGANLTNLYSVTFEP